MTSDNFRSLERTIVVSLPNNRPPTEGEIKDLATRLRVVFPVDDREFDLLLRQLHAKLAIEMDTGVALVADHTPWLSALKPNIEPFYWDRFFKFLQKKDWPPRVVTTLDGVTDEILDLLGNPSLTTPWKRRGLVVGDVQSGKTATYTALCCKAGDAGYRLIILLTGTLESLRRQTQERLDEGFVGLDSSGELRKVRSRAAIGVGLIDGRKDAGVFTSREHDFKKALLNALGFRLDSFKIPVLVVVKKNKKILEHLERWLTEFNAGANGFIDAPVLVIDDEADSASVNTRAANEDPTAINTRIRALLRLFTHSSYVGFTATPFANVFIDPDNVTDMLGSDLFPRDFIYSLESPTNYVGPQAVFGQEPTVNMLRSIEDADLIFPPKHKNTLVVNELPATLLEAARSFLLSTIVRDLREEGPTHRSMLVNVSAFTNVQEQVRAHLHAWLAQVQQDIRNYSQLPTAEALKNETLAALHATWDREFSDLGIPWPAVQTALVAGALPVVIQAVNQRTGAASLDYSKHRDNGLRVIAIGGNSLSRGLTLEGLSTSYFFRNSQMYDTLLQMGRWFGYRDGYADLCRLWLTDDAVHWYSYISMATDELRSEFRRMRAQDRTPEDFGLKVRAHPDALMVTARNKMRNSQIVERVISLRCQSLETPHLKSNENIVRANAITVERFIRSVRDEGFAQEESALRNPLWRGVPGRLISHLLRGFDVHPQNVSFQAPDLADFIETTNELRLRQWDVVLPQGEDDMPYELAGIRLKRSKRKVHVYENRVLVSGRSARVASRGIEREGMEPELIDRIRRQFKADPKKQKTSVPDNRYRAARTRPLLLIHAIKATAESGDKQPPDGLIALGLSFPDFDDDDVARRVTYRVNLVELRAMIENEVDDDIDEGDDDDES
jgi:hypothetical protein